MLALLLAGCSSLSGAGERPFADGSAAAAPRHYANPSKVYVRATEIVEVNNHYLDRYACANGRPLICESIGRLESESECRC